MPTQPTSPPTAAETAARVAPPSVAQVAGLGDLKSLDDQTEKRVDEIEMIGEEQAANLPPPGHSEVTAGMRYLHSSRTIHQLVTDRNRAVGLYLAVASLLWTASSAILNARPENLRSLIVPIDVIQRWCLPVTFGVLAVLALFAGFLLIRTRIGLIYEVAKMNVLLGLPVGRVKRVNPLSIFFIMHALISVAGGASAALFAMHLFVRGGVDYRPALLYSIPVGAAITALLIVVYVATILYTTADQKLQGGSRG
jgi:hypothetical protein